jgi:hypothetical protein
MAEELKLRKIRPLAIPRALEKAGLYRLLNEPEQAESICLDVLAVEPHHSGALKTLVLALTDQFASRPGTAKRARTWVAQLGGEYDRAYYSGLICEREARAHLSRGVAAAFAHDLFMQAIELYAHAEALAPEQNDDAILRRNSCLRTLVAESLEPMAETTELPLE